MSISKTNFRFSTNILKRLGEELNQSPAYGLIELVKNSYDADAKNCTIELINITSPGGSVIVSDDGDGMSAEDIVNGWLVLGRSGKSVIEKTGLGRIPGGNKGLGRLSALRLGAKTSLTSIQSTNKHVENTLEIDWSLFDTADLVEDVILEIKSTDYKEEKRPGTVILIESLREGISRSDVKRLARSMLLLANPFDDDVHGFKSKLVSSEHSDLEDLVRNSYFSDAEYHLSASVDSEGFATASVFDWRGEELFVASHKDLRTGQKDSRYGCPEAKFDFWAYILDHITFSSRKSKINEVRSWLREYGGVHVYHNGLRVSPYADGDDDWLGINLMRTGSPEERPSTATSIGKVVVSDRAGGLLQKTDRSGFIENESFMELKQFAVDSLNWMARRRLEVAEKRRQRERQASKAEKEERKKALDEIVSVLPESQREKIRPALEEREAEHQREVKNLRKEIQLYRTLSTAGITAAVFAHESANNPIKLIAQSIKTIRSRCMTFLKDKYEESLQKPIERIINSVESMKVLSSVTLSLVSFDKRRSSKVDIHETIKSVIDLYEPFLKDRNASVKLEFALGSPYLKGSIAAIESIITNAVNNSLVAFENSKTGERLILIRSVINNEELEIRVLDNGSGIQGISKKDIWLPGITTNPNGTGLGMTIIKDAVLDLGGQVDAMENGELGGAEIIVKLPILGS